MKEPKLLSTEREAAACRKAFKGVKVGSVAMHIHHAEKTWLEILTEPPENRIQCILIEKPKGEQAARLRLFRPLKPSQYRKLPAKLRKADADRQKKAYADWQKADADWQKADADGLAEGGRGLAEGGRGLAEGGRNAQRNLRLSVE